LQCIALVAEALAAGIEVRQQGVEAPHGIIADDQIAQIAEPPALKDAIADLLGREQLADALLRWQHLRR